MIPARPMSKIVQAMACILYPAIIVFGAYLIIYGHLTPGGGFQGGAVAASAVAMILVAFGSRYYKKNRLAALESTGLTVFIVLGILGLAVAFMFNFMANTGGLFGHVVEYGPNPGNINTGGTIPLFSIAIGLEVVGALGLILLTLGRGPEEDGDEG